MARACPGAAEHDVLRRVGKVDELYHVHLVAHVLQHRGADGVGQQRGHALLYYPVAQENVQFAALFYLRVYLMLAAGDGENVLHIVLQRVVQGVVGGDVAGVQRHDHVDMPVVGACRASRRRRGTQDGVAVLRGDAVAALHDVGLQIVADDVSAHTALLDEVII